MSSNDPDRLRALSLLVDRALGLSPEELEAWLAELRLTQPGAAATLEKVLAQEGDMDARDFLRPGQGLRPPPNGPSLAGHRIGAYTLERPLGQGGMGTVWLARRSDGRFEGVVAIKLLNLAFLDPVGSERFRREGSALARLTHPNIARLIDAGVSDAGQPFLVLEFVDGIRIDRYCDEHRLGVLRRLELFRDVLSAVAHAHANLMVHRDLKPSNILVTADGQVKLLDFGIAKLLEADAVAAERTELTAAGGTPLTPEYAAPEQVNGGSVTTATDVYALGVLLYILLAGRHPTATGTPTSSSVEQFRAVVETQPARLSAAVTPDAALVCGSTLERLKRTYRGDLDNILARALEKEATRRYATVTALDEEIDRYLRHEPVLARRPSVGYRAGKFIRRNRLAVTAGAVAGAALIGATVVTSAQMLEARRQRDAARIERDRAIFQERRATAANGFMQTVLSAVAPAGERLTTVELLGRARTMLERDFQGDPAFVARMLVDLSEHYFTVGAGDTVLALLARSAEYAALAHDLEGVAIAECRLARGRRPTETGAPHLKRGTLALQQVERPAARALAECLIARSQMAASRNQADSAVLLAREAVELTASSGDTASVFFADVLQSLESAIRSPNQMRAQLEAARRRMALLQRIGRRGTLTMLSALLSEATYLMYLGEYRAADSAFDALARIAREVDPRFFATYVEMQTATLAEALGRPDSAVAILRRHLAEARRLREPQRYALILLNLVSPLLAAGALDEARQRLAEAIPLQPAGNAVVRIRQADLAFAERRASEAHRFYMDALTGFGFPELQQARLSHRVVSRAARAALASGDLVAADTLVRHAIRIQHQLGHDDTTSAEIGISLLLLGQVQLAQGDSAAALASTRRAVRPLEHGLGAAHTQSLQARELLARLEKPALIAGPSRPPPASGLPPRGPDRPGPRPATPRRRGRTRLRLPPAETALLAGPVEQLVCGHGGLRRHDAALSRSVELVNL